MEFRIRHTSNLFRFSILLPWAVLFAGAALFGILNLFLKDDVQRAEVFLVLLLLCIGLDVIYLVLFFLEKIVGAKITVAQDHIVIRKMLRRHRKIYFIDIRNARYSYYDTVINSHYLTTGNAGAPSEMLRSRRPVNRPPEAVARLEFELVSGSRISLNDHAASYNRMRNRAKADPSIDPNADVKLYQAYQYYCAAVDAYARQNGLQIPRL